MLGPRRYQTSALTQANLAALQQHHAPFRAAAASSASLPALPLGPDASQARVGPSCASSSTTASRDDSHESLSSLSSLADDVLKLDIDRTGRRSEEPDFDENSTQVDDARTIVVAHSPTPPATATVPAVAPALANASVATLTLMPPLLRKKSGELLKSSLKLNELACNQLHRSNSMPNTKSVKFADDLENVKYFHHTSIILDSSDDSDSDSIFDFDTDSELDEDDDLTSSSNGNVPNTPSYSDNNTNTNTTNTSTAWEIVHNDTPHNSNSLNFLRLNTHNEVILESLKLNSNKNALIGFVFVQNISFQKQIIVKLTYDNWKSFIEIDNSNYISSNHLFNYSSKNSITYDKFSFIIKLDLLSTYSKNLDIKFCIEYITNGTSYWDNNNTRDYSVKLIKQRPQQPQPQQTQQPQKRSSTAGRFSRSRKGSLFDLDDGIKLKNNNNFIDSFKRPNQPQQQPQHQPRTLMKKTQSDSCLVELSSHQYSKLVENFCFYSGDKSIRN